MKCGWGFLGSMPGNWRMSTLLFTPYCPEFIDRAAILLKCTAFCGSYHTSMRVAGFLVSLWLRFPQEVGHTHTEWVQVCTVRSLLWRIPQWCLAHLLGTVVNSNRCLWLSISCILWYPIILPTYTGAVVAEDLNDFTALYREHCEVGVPNEISTVLLAYIVMRLTLYCLRISYIRSKW